MPPKGVDLGCMAETARKLVLPVAGRLSKRVAVPGLRGTACSWPFGQ